MTRPGPDLDLEWDLEWDLELDNIIPFTLKARFSTHSTLDRAGGL